jgi:hypothetical protein
MKEKMNDKKTENYAEIMFESWKNTFPYTVDKFNKFISGLLKRTLSTKFSGDLKRWEEFLNIAKTCSFLQKNPHLTTLDWILKDKNISIILAGGYGSSEKNFPTMSNLDARERENMFEAISHIKGLYSSKSEPETCIKCRVWVLKNLGPMAYHSWFYPVGLKYENGHKITYHGSNFMTNTTLQRYGDALNIDQYQDVDIKHFLNTATDF